MFHKDSDATKCIHIKTQWKTCDNKKYPLQINATDIFKFFMCQVQDNTAFDYRHQILPVIN